MSIAYLSLVIGRVNPVDRIYAIMDNFLKFMHFFHRRERERERKGRGKERDVKKEGERGREGDT